jgi:hypothetical protein
MARQHNTRCLRRRTEGLCFSELLELEETNQSKVPKIGERAMNGKVASSPLFLFHQQNNMHCSHLNTNTTPPQLSPTLRNGQCLVHGCTNWAAPGSYYCHARERC